jgi:hypothetical protein
LQFKASLGKQFTRPYLEKTHHQKGMLEWLKVYALSSNPSTGKKKKLSVVACACYPSYTKSVNTRIRKYKEKFEVEAALGKNVKPYLKNN